MTLCHIALFDLVPLDPDVLFLHAQWLTKVAL